MSGEKNRFHPDEFHVVYASDDKFAEILGVSMLSLYENNKGAKSITVYVLDYEIADRNKRNLEKICKNYSRAVPIWIAATDIRKELSIKVTVDRGAVSQYARLFVSRNLPAEVHRILYLDCDTVIDKSIKELWTIDLQGNTVGALMDAFSRYYRKNIGLQPNDIMFNSGVMLVDLDKWREHEIEEKLLRFIAGRNGIIQQGDQGALNAVLSKETFCFEPKFNSVTIFYDFNYKELMIYRKPPRFYEEKEVEIAVKDPVIIHYTTSFLSVRPWMTGCSHRYAEKWLSYKEMTPWRENKVWKDSHSVRKRFIVKCFKIVPRKILIRMAGWMQAYGRAIRNRFITECLLIFQNYKNKAVRMP